MRVVTPKQMGRIEDKSEKLGVPKRQLMLNAGKKLSERIDSYCRQELKLPYPTVREIVTGEKETE